MGRPTIRQLEYAVAVADERHFGRAARACAVSQPGLSAQIRELEEQLGVVLFERSRSGVWVTPAGERLVAHARRVLQAADDLVEASSRDREPLAGPLRLGVIPTIAPYLLPRVLPQVRRQCPALQLLLYEDRTERLVERLRKGAVDLLLLALPIAGDDLRRLSLFHEPFVLIAPEAHPLGRANGAAREAELAGQQVLLLEDGHCLRDQALSVCELAGAREDEALQATSMNTLVQMVANGIGATLLPASAVPVEVRSGDGIVVRPFAPPAPSREVGLVWRRASPRAEAFRQLGAILSEPARAAAGLDQRTTMTSEAGGSA